MVCPHEVIRMKVYDPAELHNAPETFMSTAAHFTEFPGMQYTLLTAKTQQFLRRVE